ncbi:MAG: DMP19 family protein [Planctomycetota bacterium]
MKKKPSKKKPTAKKKPAPKKGGSYDALLAKLTDDEAKERAKAAAELAKRCAEDPEAPFERIRLALIERIRVGAHMERDPVARRAAHQARCDVAAARARARGMRIARPELQYYDDQRLHWEAIERVFEAADIYEDRKKLLSILDLATKGQRALFGIWWTQSEVNNGGFGQYFSNSTAIVAPEALEGFRLVGAKKFAALLDQAMKKFPGGEMPLDREARDEALEKIDAAEFDALNKRFYALQEKDGGFFKLTSAYVQEHPEEFFED